MCVPFPIYEGSGAGVQEGPGDPLGEFMLLKPESATSPLTQSCWHIFILYAFISEKGSLPLPTSVWLVIR